MNDNQNEQYVGIKARRELKDTKNNVVFEYKKVYRAKDLDKSVLVKDETGCFRTFAKTDKWFKENFTIVEDDQVES